MRDVVAYRQLVCVKRDGERLAVTLRIGKPYRASDVDWACPVALDPLHPGLVDIHGIDSFQALMLAQQLLVRLMRGVVEDGGSFRDDESDEAVELDKLFAGGA